MRSHHLSQALLTVAVVMFFVSLETFAQGYNGYTTGQTSNIPVAVAPVVATEATTSAFETPATEKPTIASISLDDVVAAGFSEVVAVPSTATSFLAPVAYFRTKETVVSAHPEWGGAANLLAVSLHKTSDPAWLYNGGQMEVVDIAGRTQARVSVPGSYIVVTGADANKVIALATRLKTK